MGRQKKGYNKDAFKRHFDCKKKKKSQLWEEKKVDNKDALLNERYGVLMFQQYVYNILTMKPVHIYHKTATTNSEDLYPQR